MGVLCLKLRIINYKLKHVYHKYVIILLGCDDMQNNNLLKIQHFFESDLKIKNEMIKICPPNDNEYIDKYTDTVNESLIFIFNELKRIVSDFFGDESFAMKKTIELENKIKNDFYSCGYDIDKLRSFYRKCISNMDMDFIDLVKKECVGYSLGGTSSIKKANTVNEFLHYIHSYIMNNDSILQSIPIISKKENNYNYSISLRGERNPIFEQIFNLFPNDLDVGWTDMVSVNDRKLIMMVRDRGHALTIEVTINNQLARIEYFIPKICNADMINNLPGINKVSENSVGATGAFETPINNLSNSLFNFISNVPMDKDMEIKHFDI